MNVKESSKDEKEVEIDLYGVFISILKRIWVVIIAAVVFGVGAFVYFKNSYVPTYKTTVGIYIIGNDQQSSVTTSGVQIATNIAKDYELLIKDSVVLDKAVAAVKEKGIETSSEMLSKRISVESPDNTRILWVTVVWDSPEKVKNIANAVCDAAVEEIPQITKVSANKFSDAKPGTLMSSHIGRNTVIVAFVGAVLAALVLAIIFIFDDKLSSKKDIEEILGLSVLGVIPYISNDNAASKHGKA